jgi:hypothetical protein
MRTRATEIRARRADSRGERNRCLRSARCTKEHGVPLATAAGLRACAGTPAFTTGSLARRTQGSTRRSLLGAIRGPGAHDCACETARRRPTLPVPSSHHVSGLSRREGDARAPCAEAPPHVQKARASCHRSKPGVDVGCKCAAESCTRDEELAPRNRPTGAGCKPPQAAWVKSPGRERCGKGTPRCQVWIKKANDRELPFNCRNCSDDV